MKNCSGILYVVATPIGNINDISLRALEVLKDVDLILSEDTRETDKLLKNFNIEKPQIPYTDQKHSRVYDLIKQKLDEGNKLALVTDNGTPVISDPGFKLISQLKIDGYEVQSIPGANAAIAALSVSGLPTDKFIFLGFLPKKAGPRRSIISDYGKLDATLTIYESPYRIVRLLEEINEILGNRIVCIVKDLTKKFEKVTVDSLENILKDKQNIGEKGEFVILVAKKSYNIYG